MIVDGKNSVMGRVASFAAKQALLGESIDIINCEKLIISGNKKDILAKYSSLRAKGEPFHGPFFPREPERFVKRIIRGMLSYNKERGNNAFKRIKCYKGIPEEFKSKEAIKVKGAEIEKLGTLKYMTVEELSKLL